MLSAVLCTGGAQARDREIVLHAFGAVGGAQPYAGLIAGANGAFYGTTFSGGAAGAGTVVELTPQEGRYAETVLYAFKGGSDGARPQAGLVSDPGGALYGTTTQGGDTVACPGENGGCGTIFKLTPSGPGSYAETQLYAFHGGSDGGGPYAGLIVDSAGALYGTTAYGGGPQNDGTVFKLTRTSHGYSETILHAFQGPDGDGADPNGPLLADSSGALYGTTQAGGAANAGTAFELSPARVGYTEHVLYAFLGAPHDGGYPSGRLVVDAAGALYGTTFEGGAANDGTAFKLTRQVSGNYAESVLYVFRGSDGANPFGGLAADAGGALYGTTVNGGGSNLGTVFSLAPRGRGYAGRVLHNFRGDRDGEHPYANLTAGAGPVLYGTTVAGGVATHGTMFRVGR